MSSDNVAEFVIIALIFYHLLFDESGKIRRLESRIDDLERKSR